MHVLKVDQSFVAEMDRAPRDTAIVQAVIALAHALDLTVIAEGVETARQLTSLRALGCERGQGYHWSEPVCADDVRDFLRRHLVPLEAV